MILGSISFSTFRLLSLGFVDCFGEYSPIDFFKTSEPKRDFCFILIDKFCSLLTNFTISIVHSATMAHLRKRYVRKLECSDKFDKNT